MSDNYRMHNVWDKLATESHSEHQHFTSWLSYLAAGGERSLGKWATEEKISHSLAKRLSSRHNWSERTAAYLAVNPVAVDPITTDVIPATASAEIVERVTEQRLNLAQRRMRLAERRLRLAERACDLAEASMDRLEKLRSMLAADPEVAVKVLTVTAKIIGDALPKELIIDQANPPADITQHPQWPEMADSMMRVLSQHPQAMEAMADVWRTTLGASPAVVDAEVIE